jgi:hypothetical protein
MKTAFARSQCARCGGNVYPGTGRHSWYEQRFRCGCIRDIVNPGEVADMVSMPDKEISKPKAPMRVRQPGVIAARIYLSKLCVEPPA